MLLEMLKALEKFDLVVLDDNDLDYLTLACDVTKQSTVYRDTYLGNLDLIDIPLR